MYFLKIIHVLSSTDSIKHIPKIMSTNDYNEPGEKVYPKLHGWTITTPVNPFLFQKVLWLLPISIA